jgi:hypothetical protein
MMPLLREPALSPLSSAAPEVRLRARRPRAGAGKHGAGRLFSSTLRGRTGTVRTTSAPSACGLDGFGPGKLAGIVAVDSSTRQSARTRTPLTFVDRRLQSNQHRPRQPSDLGRRTLSLNTAARLLALLFLPSGHAPVVHRLPSFPNAARPSQAPPAVRSELRSPATAGWMASTTSSRRGRRSSTG